MKYRFKIMTNHLDDLKSQIEIYNSKNNADISVVKILDDEVMFVELETSITDDKLFDFGIQFGKNNFKRSIEGRL